jgi:hypothetical protein
VYQQKASELRSASEAPVEASGRRNVHTIWEEVLIDVQLTNNDECRSSRRDEIFVVTAVGDALCGCADVGGALCRGHAVRRGCAVCRGRAVCGRAVREGP